MRTRPTRSVLKSVVGLLLMISVAFVIRDCRITRQEPTETLYTVHGRAIYDTFGQGAHYSYTFTLTARNSCWAIEVLPIQAPGIGERQVFDGTNLVALRYYDTNKIDRLKVTKWIDGYVRISSTAMADFLAGVEPAIWVAYASQFYLPSGTNGLLRPFWHPDCEVRTQAFVPAQWSLIASGSELPSSVDFFYDSRGWDKVLKRGQTSTTITNRPDNSVLVATYRSFGETNVGGQIFSLAGAYTGFAAELEEKSGKRRPVCAVEVTNVTVHSTVEQRLFNTSFRGVAVVEDYRDQRAHPLTYEITNSSPLRLSDERRLAMSWQAWQSELAEKRKEMLAKDWTFWTGSHRKGVSSSY